jgi:hypothetical protein
MAAEFAQNKQNSTENAIKKEFGQVSIEPKKEIIKSPLIHFTDGNMYLGLKLVSTYDELTKSYREPVPKITWSFNNKYVDAPINGKWWKAFAQFAGKMAEALEGVDIATSNVNDNVDFAKNAMAKYRTKSQ